MKIVINGCPPSLNVFAGRQNSWEYRKQKSYWTRLVWAHCRASAERPETPYTVADVTIRYYFRTHGRRDPDNFAGKLLLDGLHKAGVIIDDDMSHIRLHIIGDYDKERPRTEITIEEAKE